MVYLSADIGIAATLSPAIVSNHTVQRTAPRLSVVIPIYNEIENIPFLHKELTDVLVSLDEDYEVIAVDDGSIDGSFEVLRTVYMNDPRWQVVRFARNYGQSAALAAGFERASSDIIVTIDADLQNDPRDIPRLLAALASGYDLISGWRQNRKGDFLKRRLPSMVANSLISRLTGVRLHDYGCTLKIYRREVVRNIMLHGELHRFIPALASRVGARVGEISVRDRARRYGKSKYGMGRIVRVIPDLLGVVYFLRYQDRAMIFFGSLSLIMGLLGVLNLVGTLIAWVLGRFMGWLVVLSVILLTGSINAMLMGLVMESLARKAFVDHPPYYVLEHLHREAMQ